VNLRIELDPSLTGFQRGARVAGTVHAGDGGPARAVDVWLEMGEHAPDFRHVAVRTDPVRVHEGRLPPRHALRFALRLPRDALPSLETEWGALRWTLVVRVDRAPRPDVRAEVVLAVR
jgi:hypothetical protein